MNTWKKRIAAAWFALGVLALLVTVSTERPGPDAGGGSGRCPNIETDDRFSRRIAAVQREYAQHDRGVARFGAPG